jgi:ABC-type branched-subunit amino acid transport system substrate-binding protein
MMLPMTRARILGSSLLVALAFGCSDEGIKDTTAPVAKNTNAITLGLLGSFSGAEAETATQVRLGAELAIAQLNSLGGLLGKRVVLRTEDDEGRVETARKKMDAMLADGVSLGIGPTSSLSATSLLDLARQDKFLYISPSAKSPGLDLSKEAVGSATEKLPPNLLRTIPSDDFQASALVIVAKQDREKLSEDPTLKANVQRCSSAIFVYQKDSFGTPVYERALKRMLEANIAAQRTVELLPSDSTEATLAGSAAQVADGALKTQANCQIVIAQPRIGGAYMRAFRNYISDPAIELRRDWPSFTTIGSDGFTQDSFITAGRTNPADPTSATAGNGSVAVAANTRPQTQTFAIFREAYRARNPGAEPGQFASTAYDAVMILALAIERTKQTENRPALRQALADLSIGEATTPDDLQVLLRRVRDGLETNYTGVSGNVDFLPEGGVEGSFVVGRIEGNKFIQYRKTIESSALAL